MTTSPPVLEVNGLMRSYGGGKTLFRKEKPVIHAINDVSFQIAEGETLGLVGESGSGKSTTGRAVLHLETPDAGSVRFRGQELTTLAGKALKPYRREMQMIFQDPYSALNPRMKVGRFVAEPMVVHGTESGSALQDRVAELFRLVGLDPAFMSRYPHEFSGGQRQRINIARAIALKPAFIVADEPITALDVSIQAQIVNLFQDLQDQLGLAYLFIAHDLSMVRYLCSRVAVMLRGRIVEIAPTEQIFSDPRHPYTQSLLAAIPVPDPDRRRPPRPPFDVSRNIPPREAQMAEVAPGHFVLDHPIQ
ncbi:ATP-binding cassette domain-containing protein [Pseudooceanicola sp. CBS1P-1]|uniref:ATP-binding cassette domain-containing protein n=1 Tax=Pseudooceanicola albus TaxID=2692189 RepID=A0A6L7G7I1_9RHOB|nr:MULTISPECIES: ATP-binding cassette domain-containing protein [Pseudooceanicola]MBT9384373.1 ATP-binding cassette domain-containing protein [Pseudooceanicola endophyticus]MXN19889.1 ATP-binding cassette domain-containing protein [Pseudooceanicola albus]